jgi:hypothetical protein
MRRAERLTSAVLAPLLKQLLGLRNAPWVNVHEVDVRMSPGKRVPLGRLQKILLRRCKMSFVQLVPDMWNVIIVEVRHKDFFPSSSR